jgi:hypothetical protein
MKKRLVVASANLPTRLPVWSSLITWLVLDRVKAPGWVWGVCGTIFAIVWITSIVLLFVEKQEKLWD